MEIRKLLVANRGEIAARIFRACTAEGIATVAVVAPDDKGSLHAREAGEVVEIASYLYSEEHIRAAKHAGADAIHPGYGFLAENADFAEAVEAAGLVFVGPTPDALRRGGDKLEAKRAATSAGIPVLPTGDPDEIGFPLMIKAAAGGGGRGMRDVRESRELPDAVAAARREAKAAFGDETVFFERYLERPRHVEIQLLADEHGHIYSLGERDCSIQRRHQKVLEEAPSPAVDTELRERMGGAAIAFAHEIGYRSLGTVEFLLDGSDFFFLELNGRIQVEHPVTEEAIGLDLVALQLAVARGDPIDDPHASFQRNAVEVRLYAEDPLDFLPQTGRIERIHTQPAPGNGSALVTAGDLLFWGDLNRRFRAFDADSGKILWETVVGGAIQMSTITYAVNGRQYVAVMTGDGQSATANPLQLSRIKTVRGHNEIYVFALPEKR